MTRLKPLLLLAVYLLAVTLPLILSWAAGLPPRPVRHELASGLGMLAFAMILAEFILSGRFRSVSSDIGQDVTMRFHQVMARLALLFALLHPFLYRGGTPSGGPRPWDTSRQLSVGTDFAALSTGILAYLLLPALVMAAIGRKRLGFRYETWRLLHGLGAVLIAALLLHHVLASGRYAAQPVVAWGWIAMAAVAGASLVYVYLVVPLLQRARPWRVRALTRLTPRQWELVLAPEGHAGLAYEAGQFAWLNIGHSSFSLHENPFSIASAPASGPEISFLVKELGDFTGAIGAVAPGTRAYVDGPFGSLSVAGRGETGVALIAGGVGLAPLLGILRQMRLSGDARAVRLVYGNRREEQIAHRAELDAAGATYVLSEPPEGWRGERGRIDTALIDRLFSPDEIAGWLFVICGPEPMMRGLEDHLIARGVPPHRILTERFDYD